MPSSTSMRLKRSMSSTSSTVPGGNFFWSLMNYSKRFFFRPDIRSLLVVSSSHCGCFASHLSLARFCRGKSCPFMLTRWYETTPLAATSVVGSFSPFSGVLAERDVKTRAQFPQSYQWIPLVCNRS